MVLRMLSALTVVLLIGSGLIAQQHDTATNIGEILSIKMTGDLAKEYARLTGSLRGDEAWGLQVDTTAMIAQKLNDGRIRIEHSSHVIRQGKTARLVTLTATVDTKDITADILPTGTPISASPGAVSEPSSKETKTLRLTLSNLKGLKLRSWSLSEEIGE